MVEEPFRQATYMYKVKLLPEPIEVYHWLMWFPFFVASHCFVFTANKFNVQLQLTLISNIVYPLQASVLAKTLQILTVCYLPSTKQHTKSLATVATERSGACSC